MSAAEPVRPHVNMSGPAPVISLNTRRRGGQSTTRGQRVMDTTPPAGSGPPAQRQEPVSDPLRSWAESIEKTFLESDLSLTDPRTAAAYQSTLDVWEKTLHGFHAQGVIDAEQLRTQTETLHGMRQVPRLI